MNLRSTILFCVFFLTVAANVSAGTATWTPDGVEVAPYEAPNPWPPYGIIDVPGGVIVVYADQRDGDMDMYAQKTDTSGVRLWRAEGIPVCTASGNVMDANLVADGAGGAIIAWMDDRNGVSEIYAQRIDASGVVRWVAGGVLIDGSTDHQREPQITSDESGGAIIAWRDDKADEVIYMQRVNPEGVIQWAPGGVVTSNTITTSWEYPRIVSDGTGGAIAAWRNDTDVFVQRVNAAGVIQWTAGGISIFSTTGILYDVCIESDDAGGAIVFWNTLDTVKKLLAQRVNASGITQWTSGGVDVCLGVNYSLYPLAMTADGTGGAIMCWTDTRNGNYDIYAQKIADPLPSGGGTPNNDLLIIVMIAGISFVIGLVSGIFLTRSVIRRKK